MSGDPYGDYAVRVEALRGQYDAIPAGAPVRLAKKTSNLFRERSGTGVPGLDVRSFDGVLSVDVEQRTADVQGMTTYEHLVAATLPYGLMPLVTPQLKTITLGGAVTGLGIESTSFRNGLPHESVREIEMLTGDGRIVTATPDGEYSDLLFGMPNSYGTLGYGLRLTIELEPVRPYVQLTHVPFRSGTAVSQAIAEIAASGEHEGTAVDFLDGTAFTPGEIYLTVGRFADEAPHGTSDYTGQEIYYRSIAERHTDTLTIHDYLWRWDTDWFWCSGAFAVQNPRVRRIVPKRYLRSDTYWKILRFEQQHGWKTALDRRRGKPEIERVVQDIEVPVDALPDFLEFFDREVGMRPVWLCPLRQRDPSTHWPLYELRPDETYVNVGFWGTVPLAPGQAPDHHNRLVEREVERLGGRKSLYSTAHYDEADFWQIYNGPAYDVLKKTYDPEGRLLNLYEKTVRGR
jgi:FAD/FMN-containing dehydrogenase